MKLCRCGRIVKKRCPKCYIIPRGTTAERGYGTDWRKLSLLKRRENPLCEQCEKRGKATPARHVHHIIPIQEAPHLRLSWSNLMSVCVNCHEEIEYERKKTSSYGSAPAERSIPKPSKPREQAGSEA